MAAGTESWCAFENCARMASFTRRLSVAPGQGKRRGIVIEVLVDARCARTRWRCDCGGGAGITRFGCLGGAGLVLRRGL